MAKRRKMSRKGSNRLFKKGLGVHKKNFQKTPQRGGIRL